MKTFMFCYIVLVIYSGLFSNLPDMEFESLHVGNSTYNFTYSTSRTQHASWLTPCSIWAAYFQPMHQIVPWLFQ